jgi:hypothetical protein
MSRTQVPRHCAHMHHPETLIAQLSIPLEPAQLSIPLEPAQSLQSDNPPLLQLMCHTQRAHPIDDLAHPSSTRTMLFAIYLLLETMISTIPLVLLHIALTRSLSARPATAHMTDMSAIQMLHHQLEHREIMTVAVLPRRLLAPQALLRITSPTLLCLQRNRAGGVDDRAAPCHTMSGCTVVPKISLSTQVHHPLADVTLNSAQSVTLTRVRQRRGGDLALALLPSGQHLDKRIVRTQVTDNIANESSFIPQCWAKIDRIHV